MLALGVRPGFNGGYMLRPSQERAIDRVAIHLTSELPLAGTDPNRHARMQTELLLASRTNMVQMEWGSILPNPEVSLAFLERLMKLSPVMAHIGLRATVDEIQGCWALPLSAEYDSDNRARYPNVSYRGEAKVKPTTISAHRLVWRSLINPNIERDTYLDHLCRVHACCNLSHLEEVDSGTNTKRGGHARHILGGQDVLFHPE